MVAPVVLGAALALAKEFLPDLVGGLTGPRGGAVAETVVEAVGRLTGSDDPEQAAAALRANPELVTRLRERVLAAHVELEQAYLADREGARRMAIERRQAGGTDARANLMILGAVAIMLACIVVLVVYRSDIPGEAVGIISTVAGLAGACLRDAFQFEFGSSRGSREKDDLLALTRER